MPEAYLVPGAPLVCYVRLGIFQPSSQHNPKLNLASQHTANTYPTHTQTHKGTKTYHKTYFQESSQHDPTIHILFYCIASRSGFRSLLLKFCTGVFVCRSFLVFFCALVFLWCSCAGGLVCWCFCTVVLVVVLCACDLRCFRGIFRSVALVFLCVAKRSQVLSQDLMWGSQTSQVLFRECKDLPFKGFHTEFLRRILYKSSWWRSLMKSSIFKGSRPARRVLTEIFSRNFAPAFPHDLIHSCCQGLCAAQEFLTCVTCAFPLFGVSCPDNLISGRALLQTLTWI